jgi:hypothetical protein
VAEREDSRENRKLYSLSRTWENSLSPSLKNSVVEIAPRAALRRHVSSRLMRKVRKKDYWITEVCEGCA